MEKNWRQKPSAKKERKKQQIETERNFSVRSTNKVWFTRQIHIMYGIYTYKLRFVISRDIEIVLLRDERRKEVKTKNKIPKPHYNKVPLFVSEF